MNFNAGSSHKLASSSSLSSSSEDEFDLTLHIEAHIHAFEVQQAALLTLYANNNLIMVKYLSQQQNQPRHRGLVPDHRVINRGRAEAKCNLWKDYFAKNPTYNEEMFRRLFRMGKNLFLRIIDAVETHDNYFMQRRNGRGQLGLSTLQKITVVFRMLAYGVPADSTGEYINIGESIAIESMKRFCRAIVEVFGARYLRASNANDIARLLQIGEKRGFPRMLESLDCMHWTWKNCPTAWAGQYNRRSGSPTIILEAVTDYDLWIWHAFFGLPGSNNDINVLEASH